MSGLAIKNISPIELDNVFYTARFFQKNILEPLDISLDSISFLGSTGKKDISGDMDIAIEYPTASKITKDKVYKEDFAMGTFSRGVTKVLMTKSEWLEKNTF